LPRRWKLLRSLSACAALFLVFLFAGCKGGMIFVISPNPAEIGDIVTMNATATFVVPESEREGVKQVNVTYIESSFSCAGVSGGRDEELAGCVADESNDWTVPLPVMKEPKTKTFDGPLKQKAQARATLKYTIIYETGSESEERTKEISGEKDFYVVRATISREGGLVVGKDPRSRVKVSVKLEPSGLDFGYAWIQLAAGPGGVTFYADQYSTEPITPGWTVGSGTRPLTDGASAEFQQALASGDIPPDVAGLVEHLASCGYVSLSQVTAAVKGRQSDSLPPLGWVISEWVKKNPKGARQLAQRYNLAELLRGMGVNLPGNGKGLAWGNVYKQIADMLAAGGNPFGLLATAADGVTGAAGATMQAADSLPPWPGDTSVWVEASQPGKLKLRFVYYEALPSSGDGAPPTTSSDTIDLWAAWIEISNDLWWFDGEVLPGNEGFLQTATLTSVGFNDGNYRWNIVQGSDKVQIMEGNNLVSEKSGQYLKSVIVKSIKASNIEDDIGYKLDYLPLEHPIALSSINDSDVCIKQIIVEILSCSRRGTANTPKGITKVRMPSNIQTTDYIQLDPALYVMRWGETKDCGWVCGYKYQVYGVGNKPVMGISGGEKFTGGRFFGWEPCNPSLDQLPWNAPSPGQFKTAAHNNTIRGFPNGYETLLDAGYDMDRYGATDHEDYQRNLSPVWPDNANSGTPVMYTKQSYYYGGKNNNIEEHQLQFNRARAIWEWTWQLSGDGTQVITFKE